MKFLISIFFCMLFSFQLSAGELPDKGPYLGGAFNWNTFDVDDLEDDLEDLVPVIEADFDDTDNGWKVFGGYNFNKSYGVEVGYYDLGEIDLEGDLGGSVSIGNIEIEALAVFGTARKTSGGFGVFAKVGAAYVDAKGNGNANADALGIEVGDEDEVVFAAGVGFNWFGKYHYGLRVEWEYFDEIEDVSTNALSAGLQYNF